MYYKIIEKRFDDLFKLADINERTRDLNALKYLKQTSHNFWFDLKKNINGWRALSNMWFFSTIDTII